MTSTESKPRRVEPSQQLSQNAAVLAVFGCAGVTIPISVGCAVVAIRRSRRTGEDHGSILAFGALVMCLLWLVAGALLYGTTRAGDVPVSRDPGGQVTQEQLRDVVDLRAGDCFEDADPPGVQSAPFIGSVRILPCTQSHVYQVVGQVAVDAGNAYPGEGYLGDRAGRACPPAFTRFVGVAPSRSSLALVELLPQAHEWHDTRFRFVTCIAKDPAGPDTHSAEGRRR